MNNRLVATVAAILGASLLAFVEQTASATTISVKDSWSVGSYSPTQGTKPTITTSTTSTSNHGTVTPLIDPYTQSLSLNTPTSGEYLFVVDPQGSGINKAIIPISLTLTVGTLSETLTDDVTYYANYGTDLDSLTWATNTLDFVFGNNDIAVSLPNETDWNMAQNVAFAYTDTVPEPATLSLLGFGMAGMGLTRRRKKN